MEFRPHAYQARAIEFIKEHTHCALFLDMGLGKTVSTLTALSQLISSGEVSKVLVIAPKSVAQNTWSNETAKWDHLSHLRLSIVMGTPAQRIKAMKEEADIYVTNRDNVSWLQKQCKKWPFDCVVIDESSSFKNFHSQRFRSLMKVRPVISRMIELTGTPAPNGLTDLWAQIKLLDQGERLGRNVGPFRETYFRPGARNGAVVYEWKPLPGSKEKISEKISDICLSMQAEDYLTLPEVIDGGLTITLPELGEYRRFQKQNVLALDDTTIVADTAVALANKLLQFTGGAIYTEGHTYEVVSDAKMDALADILEQTDEPVLLFYNFQHEKERILRAHPDAVPFKGEPEILKAWNEGRIPLLLCHPASVAYGLNMQQGGHIIIWYSPTWNLELYEQANARLHRQGQTKPVIIYHLVCRDTIDEAVMTALRDKGNMQEELVKYIKSLR